MIERFSDDGEPSGTAGSPMLNLLTGQNLCNVLVIVTRYFGGILLGTGGLVRAYMTASTEALAQTSIVEMEWGKEVEFVVNYADLEKIKYYFQQNEIQLTNLEYEENVKIVAQMTEEKINKLRKQRENLNFHLLKDEILREKFIVI